MNCFLYLLFLPLSFPHLLSFWRFSPSISKALTRLFFFLPFSSSSSSSSHLALFRILLITRAMSENRNENCKILRDVPQDQYSILDSESGLDLLTYDHIEVEGSAICCPFSREVLDVDHLFAEPRIDKSLGEDCLYMKQEGRVNFSGFEGLSSTDGCCGLKSDFGILDTNAVQGVKHGINFEFSDRIFQGAEEEKNLYLTGDILSTCPDYVLDAGFPGKSSLLYYLPTKDPSLQKVDSECHLQNFEIDCGAAELSDLSKAILPLPEPVSDQKTSFMDNMSLDELHEAFRSTFGRDTFINDKEWLKRRVMFGLQSIKELDNDTSLTGSRLSSKENEGSSLFFSNIDLSERDYGSLSEIHDNENLTGENDILEADAGKIVSTNCSSGSCTGEASKLADRNGELTTKKRLRKPTRRYIEELSEKKSKSRTCNEKMETHSSVSCNRALHVTASQLLYQGSGMASLVHGESPIALGNQFPSTIQSRRGRPRKNCTLLLRVAKGNKELKPHYSRPIKSKSSELSESDSQDDLSVGFSSKIRKVGGRRKHHRQWTLTEVLKLIEGVSQYGVGRWTEIKRIHFSSSAYRTSVDLKDKWRNLLRATGAHIHGKEVKTSKKHMSLPIPVSVTRQVRELSTIHPYPRERKSGSQLPIGTTLISTNGDGSSLTQGKINTKAN